MCLRAGPKYGKLRSFLITDSIQILYGGFVTRFLSFFFFFPPQEDNKHHSISIINIVLGYYGHYERVLWMYPLDTD